MAKKNKRQNKLLDIILTFVASIILSVIFAIPVMFASYSWILFVSKSIPLWLAIFITALNCLSLGCLFLCMMDGDE